MSVGRWHRARTRQLRRALDSTTNDCLLRGAPEFATTHWSIVAPRGPPGASLAVALQTPGVTARELPLNTG